ncbi:MAG: putative acyl-CoA dehydrogenase [Acidimicrobiia bacterium]|nr:putative acyl-CoA dehydrogenase [Acidimicrobiia bacterium]
METVAGGRRGQDAGMDLAYPPEAESFREEIRGWLHANLPKGWFDPGFQQTPTEREEFTQQWTSKLYEGGWICASWPVAYGGKGLSVMETVVLAEEFARAGAPLRADFFGDTLVGPTILQWGTEEQKRTFLPQILRGEIAWCQGFSEPEAGSDLASLRTRAELDGNEWVINGQKVWTTRAHLADYVFLLARTDPEAPPHAGISYLLVPMAQPGVERRPIIQPDGTGEFSEVFFTDARCPVDNVVGGVNNGWKVAMTTLGFERGASATTSYRRFETEINNIVEQARRNGLIDDPRIRQRLMKAYSRVQIMRINGLRALSATVQNKRDPGVAALGATNKVFWSEHHQDVMNLAIDVCGLHGLVVGSSGSPSWPGVIRMEKRPGYEVDALQSAFFFSRSESIWGGSNQIQRNIIGERVLGLPKEARSAKGSE